MSGPSRPAPSLLLDVPPSLLQEFPATKPPPGVQSNFVNPEDKATEFQTATIFLFCLMAMLFANRIYVKTSIVRQWHWDDVTCSISLLGAIAYFIAGYWGLAKGSYGRHQWDVRLPNMMKDDFTIPTYIATNVAPVTLLFVKLTFFLFYYHVFEPLRWLRWSVYIGATLTCAFYGAVEIASLVLTTRRPGNTWFGQTLSKDQVKAATLSLPLAAVGLAIDFVLLVMPLVAVMGMQLPTKRKIGVLSIFMFGILACVGSVLSIYYRVLMVHSRDMTWIIGPVFFVGFLEISIGICTVSLPAFSKMLRHHLPPLDKTRAFVRSHLLKLQSGKLYKGSRRSEITDHNCEDSPPKSLWDHGPYTELRHQPSRTRGLTRQPAYEVGELKNVHTIISRGIDREISDDKIHLTHCIQQEHASSRSGWL